MDPSTLIGLLAGLGLVLVAIFAQQGELAVFVNVPALVLVLGGTLAATLVNYPLKNVRAIFKVLPRALFASHGIEYTDIIARFTSYAGTVRAKGFVALESDIAKIKDKFLRDGLELAINEWDHDRLRNLLTLEISNMKRRHIMAQELFFYMGNYAPAFGLMGTVLGLIIMMRTFQVGPENFLGLGMDIGAQYSQLLRGMGLALVSTFYGVLLSNLVFTPIGGKLKRLMEEELMLKEFMLEGILSIHSMEHPLHVEEKLTTFVPTRERKAITNTK